MAIHHVLKGIDLGHQRAGEVFPSLGEVVRQKHVRY